jgi:hypothetical protein
LKLSILLSQVDMTIRPSQANLPLDSLDSLDPRDLNFWKPYWNHLKSNWITLEYQL